jgi:hypothetical protein
MEDPKKTDATPLPAGSPPVQETRSSPALYAVAAAVVVAVVIVVASFVR